MSEDISNNKLLEKIEEWIIHEGNMTQEMITIHNEQTVETDNKIDRILKEFDYLRDSVSRMKEENKHYYDSLSAKINLFYFMFVVFSIWIIWSI